MHYQVKGSGKPLILIHGFFLDSTLWLNNIDCLAKHFKVHAIDLWGFGYSTYDPMAYSYKLFSEQLEAFMDELNIEKAIIVGQSLGGGIGIRFCIKNWKRVEKLVLVNTAGLANQEPFGARVFMCPLVGELLLKLKINVLRRKILQEFYFYNMGLIDQELFERLTRFHKVKGSVTSTLAVMRRKFADKLGRDIEQLASLSVPTLIVWGRQDKAIPLELGKRLHMILSNSKFCIIDQAGHVPNLEKPEEFNDLLVEFLVD